VIISQCPPHSGFITALSEAQAAGRVACLHFDSSDWSDFYKDCGYICKDCV